MPVEVVDVPEGLSAHLTSMVLLNGLAGLLHRLSHCHSRCAGTTAGVGGRGRRSDCGEDACDSRNQ